MRTSPLILALCGALALGGSAASAPCTGPETTTVQLADSAVAFVIHPVTGELLSDMPVVVVRIARPDASVPRVFVTGGNGAAVLGPLAEGMYEAFVAYNDRQSLPERFEIVDSDDGQPLIKLFFNPDIDPGGS